MTTQNTSRTTSSQPCYSDETQGRQERANIYFPRITAAAQQPLAEDLNSIKSVFPTDQIEMWSHGIKKQLLLGTSMLLQLETVALR